MVRISDIDESLRFYCELLGMKEVRRKESEKGRFTLIFLAADGDEPQAEESKSPLLELTYNWDPEEYGEGRTSGIWPIEWRISTRPAENCGTPV